jgi:lipopolysaccharide export system permease protein
MNRLQRYIFSSVFMTSAWAVLVFAFVLLAGNIVKDLVGALAAGQISFETFFRLTAMLVPFVVSYALPMGILTGILLVLGRLSAQHEITAMRAAGLGLVRISSPIFLVAILGLALSLIFNLELGPRSKANYRAELADSVRNNPLSFIVPRTFIRDFPGYVIFVSEKEGNEIRSLWIWELDKENRVLKFVRAEEGRVDFDEARVSLNLTLFNGQTEFRSTRDPEDFSETRPVLAFESASVALPLEKVLGKSSFRRKLTWMTISELMAERRRVIENKEGLPAREVFEQRVTLQYAMQGSFVMAFAVLSFAMVGVPLGIKMQRRESSANLGLALVLSMGFYFILIVIDWAQKMPDLRPDLLLWAPNLIFQSAGVWLFLRVDRQ